MNGSLNPLPANWVRTSLAQICEVNPPQPENLPDDKVTVSFLPMASVAAMTGRATISEERSWGEVKKGYTRFQNGDVLFAKITPCMENGKVALADGLKGGVGAGSTEFHVLRSLGAIRPQLLTYYLLQDGLRRDARSKMTGTAGQLRVPKDFLEEYEINLPPTPEQTRIVEAIESYFTRLDNAVATLKRVQANLKRYRASVLKAAVEGRLVPTEAELARQDGRYYEPASVLLERILKERRRRWEEAELTALKAKGKPPKDDKWKAKYKEPVAPDTSELPELPEGWCWASWSQIGVSQNGRAFPSDQYCDDGVRLLRPGNLNASGRTEWTVQNTRFLPSDWADAYPNFTVGPGELVMNLTAQSLRDEFLGRVCLTNPDDPSCLLNQRLARLFPIIVDPRYVLWMFKSKVFRAFVGSLNTGSLIQHMFTTQLEGFCLPLPPLSEQVRIVAQIDRQLSSVHAVEGQAKHNTGRLLALRQTILRWAFEGKLADQDPNDEPASALLERIKAKGKQADGSRRTKKPVVRKVA